MIKALNLNTKITRIVLFFRHCETLSLPKQSESAISNNSYKYSSNLHLFNIIYVVLSMGLRLLQVSYVFAMTDLGLCLDNKVNKGI